MINFLSKILCSSSTDYVPCQQFRLDGLTGRTSCAYCQFKNDALTPTAYESCQKSHGCMHGYFPWAVMQPINTEEINAAEDPFGADNPAYTLARQTKLVRINGRNNYAQLVTCALEGYRCNRLCQFYPERIENKRQAATCARSKGCGYDGSFWNLLQPVDAMIKACYFWAIQPMPKPQCSLDNGQMAYMRNLQVTGWDGVERAYVVEVYNYNSEVLIGPAVIFNANGSSSNYGKILNAENTWIEDTAPSAFRKVRIYQNVGHAQWWLCMQGVPLSVLTA